MAQLTLNTSTPNYAEYQCDGQLTIYEIEAMHQSGLEFIQADEPRGVVLVKLTYSCQAPYSLSL